MKKLYLSAPLPFVGQKRMFAREFIKVLEQFKDKTVFVDLFGGSGLLSHITKHQRPDATVVYNDYDGYCRRLKAIPQTNALLARSDSEEKKHYFPCGTKKLILERESDGITVFLVHLGLSRRVRVRQLDYLRELLPKGRPIVLAGDFNTFRGENAELAEFMRDTGLVNANTAHQATYPAWKPLKQLDYILVSPQIEVEHFEVIPVLYSDHLPLVADLKIAQ